MSTLVRSVCLDKTVVYSSTEFTDNDKKRSITP